MFQHIGEGSMGALWACASPNLGWGAPSLASHDYFLWEIVWLNGYTLSETINRTTFCGQKGYDRDACKRKAIARMDDLRVQ